MRNRAPPLPRDGILSHNNVAETMTDSDKPTPPPEDLDDDLDFGRAALQFFVVPAIVVALCVGVFFFFAWLVSDEKTGVDYLNEVRAGSANRRWQAAFELSKIMTMDSEKARMQGLVPEMIDAFESATDDDERIRHYLALSLGHLKDPSAAPALIAALSDGDATTRLYASWALGSIADRSAVEPLIGRLGDDDPGVRKMSAYALGAVGDPRADEPLQVALSDPERDVGWNAAVALAQLGSTAGESQLLQMLDSEFLGRLADMDESQRLLTTASAIQAAGLVESPALDAALREIADGHPNVALRKEALAALEGVSRPQKTTPP